MTSLARRANQAEQMDRPDLDPAVYRAVLDDLARVNRWTLAARPTICFLDRATRAGERVRILDVGFGRGDMLRAIAAWARRRGRQAELVGCDINPNSRPAALAATPADMPIDYVTARHTDLRGPFDFVISSLVAHHMEEDELIAFVAFMEAQARRGWLVNDLHRHRAAHRAYPVMARLLGVHPIVRQDGTLSIARAFRGDEWQAILDRAGVPDGAASLQRFFPFRLCVERLF